MRTVPELRTPAKIEMKFWPASHTFLMQPPDVGDEGVLPPIFHQQDLLLCTAEQIRQGDEMSIARLDMHHHRLRVRNLDSWPLIREGHRDVEHRQFGAKARISS